MAGSAKRRTFLIVGGIVAGGGAAGLVAVQAGNGGAILTVDAALQRIDALAKGQVSSTGTWNPYQVFTHCAQSIEYSMSGYPAPKSRLFQDTVGAAAFAFFSAKGQMKHGLAQQIDGAPVLEAKPDTGEALARLRKAFEDFRRFQGPLAPHFAYGALDKQQYEQAHVMHFYNHLDEIAA